MAIIGASPFGAESFSLGAESSAILKRFRNDMGDATPSQTYSIGQGCNQDSDCAMGNMCIENTCYYKCDTKSDCPFWHTCRNDLHPTQNVCGPYTKSNTPTLLPSPLINPNPARSSPPPQEEKGFFQSLLDKIFG